MCGFVCFFDLWILFLDFLDVFFYEDLLNLFSGVVKCFFELYLLVEIFIVWWFCEDCYVECFVFGIKFVDVIGEIDFVKFVSGVSFFMEELLYFGLIL